MNNAVKLLNLWADFEAVNPDAGIADFCRYFLLKEKNNTKVIIGTANPPDAHSRLAKILGRVSRLHNSYAIIGLKKCGISTIDEFIYLNDINHSGAPLKTQIIFSNFNELSSGLLVLERLEKKGLIRYEINSNDSRSKNVYITNEGKHVLQSCYEKLYMINRFFFNKMSDDDIIMCIQLLSKTEAEYSTRLLADKEKSLSQLVNSF